jgi:hypothetical protein
MSNSGDVLISPIAAVLGNVTAILRRVVFVCQPARCVAGTVFALPHRSNSGDHFPRIFNCEIEKVRLYCLQF